MILLENKLSIFNDLIYEKTKASCQVRLNEFKDYKEKAIKNKKDQLAKMEQEIVNRKTRIANEKRYEALAKANEERRILELQKSNELLSNLIEELKSKTMHFTQSTEYKVYLLRDAEEMFSKLEPVKHRLGLTKRDMDLYFEEISKIGAKYSIEFEQVIMEDGIIGGIIISDAADTYNINNTLLEKIESKQYEIGKILYLTLKKEGELSE